MTSLEPGASPGFLLWHATLRWQRSIAAALRPWDLTHVQFVLLASSWWLGREGGEPHQSAIAAHAGTDIKMTSQVLRSLERKGLITRGGDPLDNRAKIIKVTRTGTALAKRAVAVVEATDAEFFAAVRIGDAVQMLCALVDAPARRFPDTYGA